MVREFTGTERFELRGKLGEGGMGIVYSAYDRKRQMPVAIKTLRHLDSNNLRRFKREFRALNELSHRNIIQFYELIQHDGLWLLVMELVTGEDFIEYVRAGRELSVPVSAVRNTSTEQTLTMRESVIPPRPNLLKMRANPSILPTLPNAPVSLADIIDIERLRAALGQLADALFALHMASMVHRDLKPANVRVTPEGRVVLMDFGIVWRVMLGGEDTSRTAGTPGFMAPEQVQPGQCNPASDWYAFGVMMYVALTGRLPLEGDLRDVMLLKTTVDPWPPSRFTYGIPDDLEELCVRLLARDPCRRPSGNDVLERLNVSVCDMNSSGEFRMLDVDSEIFVGRKRELDVLRQMYAKAQSGHACCVFVEGPAGIGRSSVVRRFLSKLDTLDGQRPVILSGHSWARESLTYKAFDGIIEDLVKYLSSLSEPMRRALLGDDARAIAWLFPPLERFFPSDELDADNLQDRYEQRARAIVALRTLLGKIAQTSALVLYTDDVQWADGDSLDLLLALMRRPVIPKVLMLVTLCTGEHEPADSAAELHMQRVLEAIQDEVECRHVQLGALSENDQRKFLERLMHLPEFQGIRVNLDEPLWREAAGNPMLLAELARSTSNTPHDLAARGALHLEDVIWSRFSKLPDDARALLECIVLANEPLPLRVLAMASGLSGVTCERAASALRVSHMVRIERLDHEPWLVAYHHLWCDAIRARLPDAHRMARHRGIVRALQEWPEAPHTLVAEQWLAVGEPLEAARHRFEAARDAAKHLALERAGRLYRATIELIPEPHSDRELALICCRARIGLVETVLYEQGDRDQALALLEHAMEIAYELKLWPELAQIHHLRGSLQFPDGELGQCLAEHEQGGVYARQASSPRLEALSLGGRGDAFYARGRMHSADKYYEDCLTLCRDHSLTDVMVNYRLMRALTRYFRGEISGAWRDGEEAADGAARIRYQRTELIVRCLPLSWVLYDMARLRYAAISLERALELCRNLGARRYEPVVLAHRAKVFARRGRSEQAEEYARRAVDLCREQASQFFEPNALVILALITNNRAIRERTLADAEQSLATEAWSHSHLVFYRDAMDAALQMGEHGLVERYASALERYTRSEPLTWSQFFVERARVLSRHARGELVSSDLARVLVQARKLGMHTPALAVETALAESRDR